MCRWTTNVASSMRSSRSTGAPSSNPRLPHRGAGPPPARLVGRRRCSGCSSTSRGCSGCGSRSASAARPVGSSAWCRARTSLPARRRRHRRLCHGGPPGGLRDGRAASPTCAGRRRDRPPGRAAHAALGVLASPPRAGYRLATVRECLDLVQNSAGSTVAQDVGVPAVVGSSRRTCKYTQRSVRGPARWPVTTASSGRSADRRPGRRAGLPVGRRDRGDGVVGGDRKDSSGLCTRPSSRGTCRRRTPRTTPAAST